MSYPEGVSTAVVVIGSAVTFTGELASIRAWFTPVLGGESTHIVHAATGSVLAPFTELHELTPGTDKVTFDVPHVDQPGFVDESGATATMWAYRVHVRIESADGRAITYEKNFQVLTGQSVVDLDLVPDGPILAPVSAPAPTVTSVNGATGAVTVAGAVVTLTQAEYDAIVTPDPGTLYVITGGV